MSAVRRGGQAPGSPGAGGEDGPGGRTRYFQIGFQRCGTTALAAFFNRCGIPCVHHDRGRLAQRMRVNLAAGARPLAGYDERYRAFTNMNLNAARDYFDAFKHYGALRAAYGGKFILNTRPVEHWVRSLMAHQAQRGRREMRLNYELRFGTSDAARVADCWRAEWEAHHRNVREEIPEERLLVFDIEADPPERLCDFIGLPRACARHWRQENPTMNRFGRLVAACVPLAAKRRIPQGLKQPLKRRLRRR